MLQNSGKLQEMNKISLQLFLKTELRVLKMKGILKKRLLTLLWKQEKVNGLMLNLLVLYYLAFPFYLTNSPTDQFAHANWYEITQINQAHYRISLVLSWSLMFYVLMMK